MISKKLIQILEKLPQDEREVVLEALVGNQYFMSPLEKLESVEQRYAHYEKLARENSALNRKFVKIHKLIQRLESMMDDDSEMRPIVESIKMETKRPSQ